MIPDITVQIQRPKGMTIQTDPDGTRTEVAAVVKYRFSYKGNVYGNHIKLVEATSNTIMDAIGLALWMAEESMEAILRREGEREK